MVSTLRLVMLGCLLYYESHFIGWLQGKKNGKALGPGPRICQYIGFFLNKLSSDERKFVFRDVHIDAKLDLMF